MKKFFVLAIAALLFAFNAYADNTVDVSNQQYTIYVVCPISVNPSTVIVNDLGDIIPGYTKTTGFTNAYATFEVTGYQGSFFTLSSTYQSPSTTIPGTFSGVGTGNVDITNYKWEYKDGGNWYDFTTGNNFATQWTFEGSGGANNCNGSRKVRMEVTGVTASNDASNGNWTFPVDLTATYVGM